MIKKIIFPQCSMCGTKKKGNLNNFSKGLIIKGQYICAECHQEISHLDMENEEYGLYKNKIKEILY